MKISIITTTFNSENTILDTIESLNSQTFKNFNLIVIDNLSEDKTLKKIKENFNGSLKIISEKDQGIYYALNKGIDNADGDIIFILHSNDKIIENDCLEKIYKLFINFKPDLIYGDIIIENNLIKKFKRDWISNKKILNNKIITADFYNNEIRRGWVPPHTSLFIKKDLAQRVGKYDTEYDISADYDYMVRLFSIKNIKILYTNNYIVSMSSGGKSTKILNFLSKMLQDYKIINKHRLGGFLVLLRKIFSKIKQIK